MFFSKKFQQLKVYEWDQLTVTAGDYTCEMEIPKRMYETFLADPENVGPEMSKGEALKVYLLKHLPQLFYEDWRQKQEAGEESRVISKEECEIAVIQFAYNNSAMIRLLKQRGAQIKAGNFKKVVELEEKINDLKASNIEDLTRPVYAFITFLQEGGYEAAKDVSEGTRILGSKIKISEAPEPTDIIWENRHFTDEMRKQNLRKVILSATLQLFAALICITLLKYISMLVTSKYPKTNCAFVYEQYDSKL